MKNRTIKKATKPFKTYREEMANRIKLPIEDMTKRLYWRTKLIWNLTHQQDMIITIRLNPHEEQLILDYMGSTDIQTPKEIIFDKLQNLPYSPLFQNKKVGFLKSYWECQNSNEFEKKLLDYAYDHLKLEIIQKKSKF